MRTLRTFLIPFGVSLPMVFVPTAFPRHGTKLEIPGDTVTAFVDVSVVPMKKEEVLKHQTVIVKQGRIVAIGNVAETTVPSGAIQIDGRGKFLIPGLSDMHLHIPGWTQMQHTRIDAPFSPEAELEAERQLFLELANGITTVRIMNGRPGDLILRSRAEKGELLSPHLVVGSPALYTSNTDSAVALIRAAKTAGYDFIKMYNNGPAWDSAVATAHLLHIPMSGHIPSDANGLERAIHAGYRSSEHLFGIETWLMQHDSAFQGERDAIEPAPHSMSWSSVEDTNVKRLAMEFRRNDVWNCPTNVIAAYSGLGLSNVTDLEVYNYRGEELRYEANDTMYQVLQKYTRAQRDSLTASFQQKLDTSVAVLRRRRFTKALYDGGAQFLAGTDDGTGILGLPITPGFSVHHELEEFVASGLRPYDALLIGTRNAAEFLHQLDVTGTVEIGKRADLVLLNGNPLADIHQSDVPAGVMIGGKWLDRAALDKRLHTIDGTLGKQ